MTQLLAHSSALAWFLGLLAMTVSKLVLGAGPGALCFDLSACVWACSGALHLLAASRLLWWTRGDLAGAVSPAGSR